MCLATGWWPVQSLPGHLKTGLICCFFFIKEVRLSIVFLDKLLFVILYHILFSSFKNKQINVLPRCRLLYLFWGRARQVHKLQLQDKVLFTIWNKEFGSTVWFFFWNRHWQLIVVLTFHIEMKLSSHQRVWLITEWILQTWYYYCKWQWKDTHAYTHSHTLLVVCNYLRMWNQTGEFWKETSNAVNK